MPNDHYQSVTNTFNHVADRYDGDLQRFFQIAADAVCSRINLNEGQRALDLATGTGNVSSRLALQNPRARITGIDLSDGMLSQAKEKVTRLSNVDFQIMSIDALDFEDNTFDAITCGYGVFFAPDMCDVFKETWRTLKSGGTAYFTSFVEQAFEPYSQQFINDMAEFGTEIEPPEWKNLLTPEGYPTLAAQSGLPKPTLSVLDIHLHYPNGVDDWWDLLNSTGYAGYIKNLGDSDRERFKQQHLSAIQSMMTDEGLIIDTSSYCAEFHKP